MRTDLVGGGERVGAVEGWGGSGGVGAWFLHRRRVRQSRVAAVGELGVGFHLGTVSWARIWGTGEKFPSLLGVFPPFFTMGHLRGSELLDVSAWPAIGLASTKIKKEIFHLLLLYYIPQKNLTNFILFLKKGYTHSTQAQGGK